MDIGHNRREQSDSMLVCGLLFSRKKKTKKKILVHSSKCNKTVKTHIDETTPNTVSTNTQGKFNTRFLSTKKAEKERES